MNMKNQRAIVLAIIASLLCTWVAVARPSYSSEKKPYKSGKVALVNLRKQHLSSDGIYTSDTSVRIGGVTTPQSIETMGSFRDSTTSYALNGDFVGLEGICGFRDTILSGRTAEFAVYGDGRLLFDSGKVESGQPATFFQVWLKDVEKIQLVIRPDSVRSSIGAAFGNVYLYEDGNREAFETLWTVEIEGHPTQQVVAPPSGLKELAIPIPIKDGFHRQEVTTQVDKARKTITVTIQR